MKYSELTSIDIKIIKVYHSKKFKIMTHKIRNVQEFKIEATKYKYIKIITHQIKKKTLSNILHNLNRSLNFNINIFDQTPITKIEILVHISIY